MIRVKSSVAGHRWPGLAALACAVCAASPVQADDNNWFDKILAAAPPAVVAENRQPARKRLAAFTKRPAQTVAPDQAPDEPKSNSLSGGITWQASSSCVPSALRGVLADLVGNFGPVVVTSTCRGKSQNRAAGGADHSYHLTGEAVDFRVSGSASAVQAFLASSGKVGGLKHYGGGLYHIDTGPRRSW
jgi:Peptidase M15